MAILCSKWTRYFKKRYRLYRPPSILPDVGIDRYTGLVVVNSILWLLKRFCVIFVVVFMELCSLGTAVSGHFLFMCS